MRDKNRPTRGQAASPIRKDRSGRTGRETGLSEFRQPGPSSGSVRLRSAFESLKQDVRFGLRTLRKDLGFTIAATLILGIGIGANTAVFSVVNTVLLRPLPFSDPDRLVWITNAHPEAGPSAATSRVSTFEALLNADSFEQLTSFDAFFIKRTYSFTGRGESERLVGAGIAQNLFPLLGVKPDLGRNFTSEESQLNGRDAVILSHGLWERRFGADPAIIGAAVTLNDRPFTIVGVMPQSFDFASVFAPATQVDLFTPLIYDRARIRGNMLAIIGRLKREASLTSAQAECDSLIARLQQEHPQWGDRYGARLFDLADHVRGPMRQGVLLLWSAVGLVLLIVCANLSNLLLTRAAARRKEIAVRRALGAGRARIARQLLTESLLLSAIGAVFGLLLAIGATAFLADLDSIKVPLLSNIGIDSAALAVTLLASISSALLAGLLPAFQGSRLEVNPALKDASRGSSEGKRQAFMRASLVVSEVALACILLVGAGLLLRSFVHLLQVDLGFRPSKAMALRVDTSPRHGKGEQRTDFLRRVVESVRAVPGVDSAAITDALPLDRNRSWGIRPLGKGIAQEDWKSVFVRMVSEGFIETMGIPIIAGREFTQHDRADSRKVLLINQTTARLLWPGKDPIGRLAEVGGRAREIVGIVGDVRHRGPEIGSGFEAYMPITQAESSSLDLVVRTSSEPAAMLSSLRQAIRSVDPVLPVTGFRSMGQLLDRSVSPRRFVMSLLGAFAAIAFGLALLGIYGVVSYSVGRRRAEIGIRMALGASVVRVQSQVIRETLRLAAMGIVLGILASLALSRMMASMLFGISATDALTLSAAVVCLAAMAAVAGYLPARRASKVDPASALRSG